MNLFVPGRICLFGEHSDWAGSYRRINGALEKGMTIIAGTNQGIHAEVKPHPSKLIFKPTLDDGTRMDPFEIPMERDVLLAEADKGGFFSYIAGTAHQVLTHYRVRGLEIDNYKTDLPIRKGLSSSAALCVLVARAFNRIYDLKMTVRGEMELAYFGEITTPSRCGRMDQGCAYGNRPVLMTFDGDKIDVTELAVPTPLYYVIVDLQASKDTKEILNRLNHCYPFAEDDQQKKVQQYLGPTNRRIVEQAVSFLSSGDARNLGALMKEAQELFDEHCAPACPSQLTAPVLHKLLSFEPIGPYIFGGKGVGSQGDGTAQFLVKDEESQERVLDIIKNRLGLPGLKLTLGAGRRVRKAVIPAAGFGTRMFPASKAVKKELFPIIDSNGRIKPVIMAIVEEAFDAGIEEVCIVVQKNDLALFQDFFYTPPSIENFNKLSRENREYWRYVEEIGHRITFVTQETQEGFGHAVYCTREWVDNEPFLLLLGDHLYASCEETSCARSVLDLFETVQTSVVGLQITPGEVLQSFGCATGTWNGDSTILSITEFSEKPTIEYAREHLSVDGLDADHFLTVFGMYVLTPGIFDHLAQHINANFREKGEFQLTSCLDSLRREQGFSGKIVNGRRFDIGLPEAYRQSIIDFAGA